MKLWCTNVRPRLAPMNTSIDKEQMNPATAPIKDGLEGQEGLSRIPVGQQYTIIVSELTIRHALRHVRGYSDVSHVHVHEGKLQNQNSHNNGVVLRGGNLSQEGNSIIYKVLRFLNSACHSCCWGFEIITPDAIVGHGTVSSDSHGCSCSGNRSRMFRREFLFGMFSVNIVHSMVVLRWLKRKPKKRYIVSSA